MQAPMETTYANLPKPAGLSQTRSMATALIDETTTRIFMRKGGELMYHQLDLSDVDFLKSDVVHEIFQLFLICKHSKIT